MIILLLNVVKFKNDWREKNTKWVHDGRIVKKVHISED